jgi:16S rRNA (cytosine967-C5)-methyltransferase
MQYSSLIGHAIELFDEIKKWEFPADKVIHKFYELKRYLGSSDRNFITESVYDLLRNYSRMEFLLKVSLEKFPQYIENPPTALLFLTLFVFRKSDYPADDQTFFDLFKEKLPDIEIDELISIIETNLEKVESEGLSVKYSFPDWMVQKFSQSIPQEEVENLLTTLNQQAPLTIRVVTSKIKIGLLREKLEKKKVEVERTQFAPDGLTISRRINFQEMEEFRRGLFEVQDEGSQIVTLLTDPKPGMIILDVCAGGGGKTIYMSELMKNAGKIFVFDIDKERIKNLGRRIKDKNYKNINIVKKKDELKYFINTFDVVLIDAPCTGSGTIRRNPDLKWRIKEEDLAKYTKLQLEILNEYSKMVKINGSIVYITCSLFKEENEDIVSQFLNEKTNFTLSNIQPLLKIYGIEEIIGDNYLHLYPHLHKTDGFFGCVIRRER